MKALKPSHREHKRYLLIAGKDASKENIEDAILKFIGVLGLAKACPDFIKRTEKGIILAVNRQELDKVKAALLLSGLDMNIKSVSGILRKL